MEDTPSNYNIPNGRLDGKSLGLKAILLHAKKQGLNLAHPQSTLGSHAKKDNLEIIEEIRKQNETP